MRRTLVLVAGIGLLASGCASYSTISSAGINTPKVYSGTRLDVASLRGDESTVRKFPASPPRRPALDLPLSLVLDTALLPLTLPSAFYELIFE